MTEPRTETTLSHETGLSFADGTQNHLGNVLGKQTVILRCLMIHWKAKLYGLNSEMYSWAEIDMVILRGFVWDTKLIIKEDC